MNLGQLSPRFEPHADCLDHGISAAALAHVPSTDLREAFNIAAVASKAESSTLARSVLAPDDIESI